MTQVQWSTITLIEEKPLEDKIFSPECSLVTSQMAEFEKHKWQNNLFGASFGGFTSILVIIFGHFDLAELHG